MMQIRKVSQKRKIENFVECRKRPFTTRTIAEETSVPLPTVIRELRKLKDAGKVKIISKENGFSVFSVVKETNKNLTEKWDFIPQKEKLEAVYDKIENTNSIKKTAEELGFSNKVTSRCVTVLLSVGAITKTLSTFKCISKQLIPSIPKNFLFYQEKRKIQKQDELLQVYNNLKEKRSK